jgi:hypothetical protein
LAASKTGWLYITRRTIGTFVKIPARKVFCDGMEMLSKSAWKMARTVGDKSPAAARDCRSDSASKIIQTLRRPFFPVSKSVTIRASHEIQRLFCRLAANDSALESSLLCPRQLAVNLLKCPGNKWPMLY